MTRLFIRWWFTMKYYDCLYIQRHDVRRNRLRTMCVQCGYHMTRDGR